MTKIKQYELDSTIHEDDKVIGTDGNPGVDLGRTKNFTIAALTAYLNTALEVDDMIGGSGTLNTIPMWTPDGTTLGDSIISRDPSVVSPDNAILVAGKLRIDTTGSSGIDVGPIAGFSTRIVLHKDVEFQAGIMDYSDSLGTAGQVLTSTGTTVSWVDVSALSGNVDGSGTLNTIAMWTPDGNTLGDSIILYDSDPSNDAIEIAGKLSIDSTGSVSDVGPIADFTSNISFYKDLYLTQGLRDSANNLGASGQILSSTGTATQWINNSVVPANNIVGSGTLNTIAMFTPNGQAIGDSPMFKLPGADWVQVGVVGSGQETVLGPGFVSTTVLGVTNVQAADGGSVTLQGNVEIGNASTDTCIIDSTVTFYGPVKDRNNALGTAGKILISDSSGQLSFGDQTDTTYTHSSAQAGSDAVIRLTDGVTNQDVTLVAGNSISLTDDGSNNITIAATGGAANTEYDLASSQNGNNVDVSLTGSDATTDSVSLIAGANVTLTDDGSNNITIDASSAVTYDLVGTYNANDTILTLQGSDATSDTFTLHSGSGISFSQDAVNGITTVDFDLSNSGAVGGTGTLNTIPLWTPDGQTLGDSNITVDANDNVTITGAGGASTEELKVVGVGSKIVIESSSAGDTHLEFRPNVTSNHAAVFELTSTNSSRHFVWEENGNELMRLNGGNQNLGIGTTNPMFPLTVNGAIAAEGTGCVFNYGSLLYTNMNYTAPGVFRVYGNTDGTNFFDIVVSSATATFNYGSANIYLNSGNVGIGTATPSETLHVDGNVRFTGALYASDNDKGNSGQVLISTGTGTDWIDASDLTDNVSGSGTAGKLPYWNPDGSTLADSLISQTSDNSITIGVGATATGTEAISLSRSEARADYSFAHGYESITDGEYSVTLGKGGYTAGDHSAAIGYKGISLGQSAISGGHSSSAGGDGAVALGHNASAGNYGVAKATSTFPNDQTTFDIYGIVGTVAVGTFLRYGPGFDVADPRIEVTQFTDLGNGAATITIASGIRPIAGELLVFEEQTPQRNDHQGGVALGNDAFSLGQGAVALGQDAVADADFAVAIGKTASTSTSDSIALGGGSTKILIEALVSASSYADDTAAAAGGVAIGELYRNGNVVQIRLT